MLTDWKRMISNTTGMYYLAYILASYLILFMYKLLLADQFVRNIKLTRWLPTYDIFVL